MIKRTFVISSFVLGLGAPAAFALQACSGDDDSVSPNEDASAIDTDATTPVGDGGGLAANDGSTTGSDGGSTTPTGPWVLVTSGTTSSELVAVDIATSKVDGRLPFSGGFGTAYNAGSVPFLLEQQASIVGELQSDAPWNLTSTWNVSNGAYPDGGSAYSNPAAVVVSAGNKAYVLLNTRNTIDVIDPTQVVDGGAPSDPIDLSALLQSADGDGLVDVQAGFYDASRQRLWVVLENIFRTQVPITCNATKATLIAINTTDNSLVNLGGTGPGGAYTFTLTDPLGVAYDAANDRVITTNFGCQNAASSDAGADAGPGPLMNNGIEIMSLADGTSSTFMTESSLGRGGMIALTGNNQAVVVFSDPVTYAGTGYVVDLSTRTTLDTLSPLATPDAFVSDGNGNLYGTMYGAFPDGGSGENVVKVTLGDGGSVQTLAAAPFTDPTGYVGGVALWSAK